MLKKLRILLLALLTALCCTVTAWADYDYIDRYDVTAAPNVDDGSLTITSSACPSTTATCTSTWTAPTDRERRLRSPTAGCRSTCIPSAAIP